MDVTDDVTCTLRAEAHHPPCVLESAGFCTEHSAKARGIGYEEETSPTLRAGTVPAAVALYEKKAVAELLKTAPEPLGEALALRQQLAKLIHFWNEGCGG